MGTHFGLPLQLYGLYALWQDLTLEVLIISWSFLSFGGIRHLGTSKTLPSNMPRWSGSAETIPIWHSHLLYGLSATYSIMFGMSGKCCTKILALADLTNQFRNN